MPKTAFFVLCGLYAFHIGTGLDRLEEQPDLTPEWANYRAAGQWLARNADPDALVCARKPHWLRLIAQRRTLNFVNAGPEAIWAQWDSLGVDYVVFEQLGFSSTNNHLRPALEQFKGPMERVWQSADEPWTAVFHLTREGEE